MKKEEAISAPAAKRGTERMSAFRGSTHARFDAAAEWIVSPAFAMQLNEHFRGFFPRKKRVGLPGFSPELRTAFAHIDVFLGCLVAKVALMNFF